VVLVLRGIWPALKVKETKSLLYLVVLSAVAIGLLFGAGLMYGQHTHIAIMEYWRWWVVHLWVEGVFEVFATAIVSALFVRMGLVRISVATTSVLLATLIFLGGGVLGTFHHLYFSGTPTGVIALGSVFSALEVVPLVVIDSRLTIARNTPPFRHGRKYTTGLHVLRGRIGLEFDWCRPVRLPDQSTAGALLHARPQHDRHACACCPLRGLWHAWLGLMLFCLRGLTDPGHWNNRLLAVSFWCLNIGLGMMVFLALLPQGLLQAHASFAHGYAYARSAAFIHSP